MRIQAVGARDLSPEHQRIWASIQQSQSEFGSPFLRPEFTLLAADVWKRVAVGILESDGEPVGFCPFQRSWFGTARPVAPLVSDYQGVIVRPGVPWTAEDLLRGCGLASMEFNHLLVSQTQFQAYHARRGPSWAIDLAGGFEGYRKSRREAGSNVISQMSRLGRKLEREVGPMRFELDVRDPALIDWIAEHQTRKCDRKGHRNTLAMPAVRRLFDAISATRSGDFSGTCTALYAGDRIAAALLGLRTRTVWHGCFLGFDEELWSYSPGILLLLRLAEAAPAAGVGRIELGKGNSPYKMRLANASVELAEARVELRTAGSVVPRVWNSALTRARRAPWMGAARRMYRWATNR